MLVRPPGLFRTIWLIAYILSITHTYRVSSELRLVACWVTSTWTWVFVGVVGESLATENFNLFLPWVPCDRLGTKFSFQGCRFNQTPAIGYVAKPNLFFKNLKIYFPNFRQKPQNSEEVRLQNLLQTVKLLLSVLVSFLPVQVYPIDSFQYTEGSSECL